MKKVKRFVALFTALVLVCLSATGCNAIDEMRENQAFYTETGTVMLRGNEYLPLPENEYFSPFDSEDSLIQITEADLPVLLSVFAGESATLYNDGIILTTDYGDTHYCRADKHDQYSTLLSEPFVPTSYCYTYSVLDTDTFDYIEYNYKLTDEQVKAVDEILATVTPTWRDRIGDLYADYSEDLYACDDTMLMRKESIRIEKFGSYYCLAGMMYDDTGILEYEYAVPNEYNAIFDNIIKASVDAAKAEEIYYSDIYDEDEDEYDLDYEVV